MELGRYLTPILFNNLHSDVTKIKEILNNSGYSTTFICDFHTVAALFAPYYMLKLFNEVEDTLNEIDNNVDWINPYSAMKLWKKQNGALYTGVKRWFDWAEFNKNVVNKKQQKTTYLQTTKYTQITDLYDNDGNKIICLNGYFESLPKKEGV